MKPSPVLGGLVTMVAIVIGGLVWAIDVKHNASQARDDIRQHSQLVGHTDTMVGIAEINSSIVALAESLEKLYESQTRMEARIYDIQLRMRSDGDGPRSELAEPVN